MKIKRLSSTAAFIAVMAMVLALTTPVGLADGGKPVKLDPTGLWWGTIFFVGPGGPALPLTFVFYSDGNCQFDSTAETGHHALLTGGGSTPLVCVWESNAQGNVEWTGLAILDGEAVAGDPAVFTITRIAFEGQFDNGDADTISGVIDTDTIPCSDSFGPGTECPDMALLGPLKVGEGSGLFSATFGRFQP